jgi:hypothetical protein
MIPFHFIGKQRLLHFPQAWGLLDDLFRQMGFPTTGRTHENHLVRGIRILVPITKEIQTLLLGWV